MKKRLEREDEIYNRGVSISVLKTRTVKECLNCKKPECNYCPVSEIEDKYERKVAG